MPYRIDVNDPPDHALETLIDLGALDVESRSGSVAALMPDAVSPAMVTAGLGGGDVRVSTAIGRDDDSIWTLGPRAVRVGSLQIVPAGAPMPPGALQMIDSAAFGTGLHATTALCVEAIETLLGTGGADRMLDVGTGSGILAMAAIRGGVARAVGLDLDGDALSAAAGNARLNGYQDHLILVRGGPDAVRGSWPLVVANIRAADLMAMAPVMIRRVASKGRLVLSGIPSAVAPDVEHAYRRSGMTRAAVESRSGWTVLVLRPTW